MTKSKESTGHKNPNFKMCSRGKKVTKTNIRKFIKAATLNKMMYINEIDLLKKRFNRFNFSNIVRYLSYPF